MDAVINAKRDAVGIAEVELCKVAVQMLLRAMLMDAPHSALEDRIQTFDGVGVHLHLLVANVLSAAIIIGRMLDAAMESELLADVLVLLPRPSLAGFRGQCWRGRSE